MKQGFRYVERNDTRFYDLSDVALYVLSLKKGYNKNNIVNACDMIDYIVEVIIKIGEEGMNGYKIKNI